MLESGHSFVGMLSHWSIFYARELWSRIERLAAASDDFLGFWSDYGGHGASMEIPGLSCLALYEVSPESLQVVTAIPIFALLNHCVGILLGLLLSSHCKLIHFLLFSHVNTCSSGRGWCLGWKEHGILCRQKGL